MPVKAFDVAGQVKNAGDQWVAQNTVLFARNEIFRRIVFGEAAGIEDFDPVLEDRDLVFFGV